MSESPYHISLLGDPRVLAPSGTPVDLPRGKPLALLVFLAVEVEPASRDELFHFFWPDSPRKKAQGSLRQAVWFLRQTLSQEIIRTNGEYLFIPEERISTDLEQLDTLLSQGKVLEASELWTDGPFRNMELPDAREWSRWTEEVRSRFEWRLEEALWTEGDTLRTSGKQQEALRRFRRGTLVKPYSPRCHMGVIESLLTLGDIREAENAFSQAKAALGEDLEEELDEVWTRIEKAKRNGPASEPGPRKSEPLLPFFGRSMEMGSLSAFWDRGRADDQIAVLISGPRGFGKSRLIDEFLRVVDTRDAGVILIRPSPMETDVEWVVASELTRGLRAMPGAAGISEASSAALDLLAPSKASGKSSGLEAVPAPGIMDALDDLLSAVSFEQPLLVALDDLQWVDQPSRTTFARLIRNPTSRAVMFLLAAESGPEGSGSSGLIRSYFGESTGVEMLDLPRLDRRSVSQILAEGTGSPDVSPEIGEALWQETAGLPRWVSEIATSLRDHGTATEILAGDPETGVNEWESKFRSILRGPIRTELRSLSLDAQRVAAGLSQNPGRSGLPDLISRIPDLSFPRIESGLHELARASLLNWPDDNGLELVTPATREAAMDLFSRRLPEAGLPRRRRRPGLAGIGLALALAGALSLLLGSCTPVKAQTEPETETTAQTKGPSSGSWPLNSQWLGWGLLGGGLGLALFSLLRDRINPGRRILETDGSFQPQWNPGPDLLEGGDKGDGSGESWTSVRTGRTVPIPAGLIEDEVVRYFAPPEGTLKILGPSFEVIRPSLQTIRIFSLPGQGSEVEVTFGRKPGPPYTHIQLKRETVSGHQATVHFSKSGTSLINYSRTNPTKLNGNPLGHGPVALSYGDEIEMGGVVLRFHQPQKG